MEKYPSDPFNRTVQERGWDFFHMESTLTWHEKGKDEVTRSVPFASF